MDVAELVHRYPTLYHVTAAGSWPAIRAHGLLTTAQIVGSGGFPTTVVEAALRRPRRASMPLRHPTLGDVVIRDQSPLRPHILQTALVDMTLADWLTTLNGRVFFWLHPQKVDGLLNARRARSSEHDVIVIDTRGLVAEHEDRIRLSPINSGAALWPNAAERGRGTFSTIAEYPYAARRRGRSDRDAIAELAVLDEVPDLAKHVLRVERRRGATPLTEVGPGDGAGRSR